MSHDLVQRYNTSLQHQFTKSAADCSSGEFTTLAGDQENCPGKPNSHTIHMHSRLIVCRSCNVEQSVHNNHGLAIGVQCGLLCTWSVHLQELCERFATSSLSESAHKH